MIATPIRTDLGAIRGVFIVAVCKDNDEIELKGIDHLETVEAFVKDHEIYWCSQSEDLDSAIIKLFLTHLQIFGVISSLVLPWSQSARTSIGFAKRIAEFFGQIVINNSCILKSVCGDLKWIYCQTILIFCFPFIIVFAYIIMQTCIYLYKCRVNKDKKSKKKLIKHIKVKIMLLVIVLLYQMYVVLTQAVYKLWICKKLGSMGSYMIYSYDIKCDDPDTITWVLSLGIPGFIFFILGIPYLLVHVLYMNRNTIGMFETRRYLGSLYNGYRLDVFYWECIIMVKKIVIVGVIYGFRMLGSTVQIPMALMMFCIFIALEYYYKPYAWLMLQNIERCSLVTHTLSFFLASLYAADSLQDGSMRTFLEVLIISINIVFVLYVAETVIYFRYKLVGFRRCFFCYKKGKSIRQHSMTIVNNPMQRNVNVEDGDNDDGDKDDADKDDADNDNDDDDDNGDDNNGDKKKKPNERKITITDKNDNSNWKIRKDKDNNNKKVELTTLQKESVS